MREIKFKYYFVNHAPVVFILRDLEIGVDFIKIGPIKAKAQYTGIEDANGVEIYEGDRLTDDSHHLDWVVSFIGGSFVAHDPEDELEFVMLDDYSFRVKGSIH